MTKIKCVYVDGIDPIQDVRSLWGNQIGDSDDGKFIRIRAYGKVIEINKNKVIKIERGEDEDEPEKFGSKY